MTDPKAQKGIQLARKLLADQDVSAPEHINLDVISIENGIYTRMSKLVGCDARLRASTATGKAIATISDRIELPGQRRFALAHEIGHHLIHVNDNPNWDCTGLDLIAQHHGPHLEVEANVFAAELLMPESLYREACVGCVPSHEALSNLAGLFSVSLTAAAYRYVEVGNHPCALVMSKDGRISWFVPSHDFRLRLHPRGHAIHEYSCAGDYLLNGVQPPETPGEVRAFCWLENSDPDDRRPLFEQAIPMPRYGQVLSLIFEP